MESKARLPGIDVLRFLGLSLIILAHVNPPAVLFQLRNFDVPLMLFVSGLSFSIAKKNNVKYSLYVFQRFKRLVLPAWFFLILYFTGIFLFNITPLKPQLNFDVIASSFSLVFGIGYVWVIRVFICVALLAPILVKFFSTKGNKASILILIFSLLVNEVLAKSLLSYISGSVSTSIYILFFEIPPYAIIFCIGYIFLRLKRDELIFITAMSAFCFCAFAFYYQHRLGFVPGTQNSKYPPLLYYTSYSIFMMVCFFSIRDKLANLFTRNKYVERVFVLISNNSLWIYLWHILFVTYFNITKHEYNFIEKYLCAYAGGVLLTYIQLKVVTQVLKYTRNAVVAKNIKMIFTG